MIKNFSKSKIVQPIQKKNNQMAKTMRKHKRISCKENYPLQKFNQTTSSIRKIKSINNKNYKNQKTIRSKSSSPLQTQKSKRKNKQIKKDQKFIDKLFSKNSLSTGTQKCFVQGLIQKMVPKQNIKQKLKFTQTHYLGDFSVESQQKNIKLYQMIQKQNLLIKNFNNQISQLKLYLTNFIFKVFDFNIIYRKNNRQIEVNHQIQQKMSEVVSYIDSLVRHLNLQSKLKTHCQILANDYRKNQDKQRGRCHTESLKIPIQTYIDSVKHKNMQFFQNSIPEQQQKDSLGEMIQFISRKNSQSRQPNQQTIVAKRQYTPEKAHQLKIKVGDKVTILKQISNSKMMGVNNGTVGYFPKEILT